MNKQTSEGGIEMSDKMRESAIALMEAAMIAGVDEYFSARPQLMRTRHEECLYEAGFKRAWQAAQVPVMVEAVAEAYVYEDVDGDDILGLRLLKEDYPMQHGEKLYIEPTTSITQAELERLRRDAERLEWLDSHVRLLTKNWDWVGPVGFRQAIDAQMRLTEKEANRVAAMQERQP